VPGAAWGRLPEFVGRGEEEALGSTADFDPEFVRIERTRVMGQTGNVGKVTSELASDGVGEHASVVLITGLLVPGKKLRLVDSLNFVNNNSATIFALLRRISPRDASSCHLLSMLRACAAEPHAIRIQGSRTYAAISNSQPGVLG
jgi:hypothetical protein